MPMDKTRVPVDPRQGYRGITAQQGRVILDRDVNALQTLTSEAQRLETLDVVGPCGTPETEAFRITVATPQSLVQPARLLGLASLPAPDPFDFHIGAGTMYLGGLRAVFTPPA